MVQQWADDGYKGSYLIVSHDEASSRITEQLAKAVDLSHQPVASNSEYATWEQGREKWIESTGKILRGILDSEEFFEIFDVPPGPLSLFPTGDWSTKHRVQSADVEERIKRLRGILHTLHRYPEQRTRRVPGIANQQRHEKRVFVVHGHDEAARHAVLRSLERLGLEPVILHEQPNKGRTIIEKFEAHSDVRFAVVLLTPDDFGYSKEHPADLRPRARQNVVLELGYFVGRLGREKVCALHKGNIEIPSDYHGVLYVPLDDLGAWKLQLATELRSAGFDIDLNKLP